MDAHRIVEPTAALLAISILLGGSIIILAPFAAPLLWAAILVYSTWQPYSWLTRCLGGRSGLAASLMLLLLLVFAIGPFVYAGAELARHAPLISAWVQQHMQDGFPELPDWLVNLPYVGEKLQSLWQRLASGDSALMQQIKQMAGPAGRIMLKIGAAFGSGLVMLLLSLVIALFLYTGGDGGLRWLRGGMRRIAGDRGEELLILAGGTIRGVVYGILGTAGVQGLLAWFGFLIAGVPGAVMLGLATAFLSLIPMGPALLWGPAALWLYQQGETGWAIFMAVWGIGVVSTADNVVKPLLIGKDSNLPFLLIMLGVLGGALSFGLLGIFLGPTLLSVAYAVLKEWANPRPPVAGPATE